jgi:hypothetical protein
MHSLVSMLHLGLLCAWGGVVATEAVVELSAYRRREMLPSSVRLHYWIDLLVELPVIVGVIVTGLALTVLTWPLDGLHVVKLACVSVPIAANLYCIAKVVQRRNQLESDGDETKAWEATRRIIGSAAVGVPFALAGALLGIWMAFQRLGAK